MKNRVKEIRKSKGLTQSQLAALTNGVLTQGDISKLETGYYSKPQPKAVRETAKALQVSEDELFPPKKG